MKKIALIAALFAAFSFSALAQEPPAARCNAHHRQFKKPWTWLESNMCQEDYEQWVTPRLKDHWYKDKYFWIGVAVIGASLAADAHSTSTRPRFAREGNHILGSNPSNGELATLSSVGFAAEFGLHVAAYKKSHNDPSLAWREFGRWAIPAAGVAIPGVSAIHNYKLDGNSNHSGRLR